MIKTLINLLLYRQADPKAPCLHRCTIYATGYARPGFLHNGSHVPASGTRCMRCHEIVWLQDAEEFYRSLPQWMQEDPALLVPPEIDPLRSVGKVSAASDLTLLYPSLWDLSGRDLLLAAARYDGWQLHPHHWWPLSPEARRWQRGGETYNGRGVAIDLPPYTTDPQVMWDAEERMPVALRRLYYRSLLQPAFDFDEGNGNCLGADAYEWTVVHPKTQARARAFVSTHIIAALQELYTRSPNSDHPALEFLRGEFAAKAIAEGIGTKGYFDAEEWEREQFDDLFAPLKEGYKP